MGFSRFPNSHCCDKYFRLRLQVHKCSGTWIVCHWLCDWMSARDNDKLCLIRSDQFTCENWERFAHFGECWSLDNNIITSTMPTWHSWLPNWYKVLNYPLECNGTGSVLNWSIAAESKTLILSAESEVKKIDPPPQDEPLRLVPALTFSRDSVNILNLNAGYTYLLQVPFKNNSNTIPIDVSFFVFHSDLRIISYKYRRNSLKSLLFLG